MTQAVSGDALTALRNALIGKLSDEMDPENAAEMVRAFEEAILAPQGEQVPPAPKCIPLPQFAADGKTIEWPDEHRRLKYSQMDLDAQTKPLHAEIEHLRSASASLREHRCSHCGLRWDNLPGVELCGDCWRSVPRPFGPPPAPLPAPTVAEEG